MSIRPSIVGHRGRWLLVTVGLACGLAGIGWLARAADDPIDWNRAKQLHQRASRGEKLSPADQAYYERAKKARARMQGGAPGDNRTGRPAGTNPPGPASASTTGLKPLTELGQDQYKGEESGLYGGGSNEPPPAHLARLQAATARIEPLDAAGRPARDGKIVLLSVGMSNTTQEFSRFLELSSQDKTRSARVVLVDGAQGGRTAMVWAGAGGGRAGEVWSVAEQRLRAAGVTPRQVQAIWMKQANPGPAQQGDFPKHAELLRDHLTTICQQFHEQFPNCRVAYLSSRTYGGYATTQLNPEPYAYESAFAVRWVIQKQMEGNPELNCDAEQGAVRSPALAWGPYLWANGTTPRQADQFVWRQSDFGGDGTHPSDAGRQKVAELLLKFFHTDTLASGWYLAKQRE